MKIRFVYLLLAFFIMQGTITSCTVDSIAEEQVLPAHSTGDEIDEPADAEENEKF